MCAASPTGEKDMPIYEYNCSKCENVFEEWLKFSEERESMPCPRCGGEARRIISNTAFVLKGGGWYVTDYGYRKGRGEGAPAKAADSDSKSPDQTAAVPSSSSFSSAATAASSSSVEASA
jgi:putative FmdB family regulatory protein